MSVKILSLVLSPIDWLGPWVVGWYWKFQVISLALLIGTVLFGALTIIAGREANKRQAVQVLNLEKDNIEARRALEEEKTTRLELEKSLARRTIPLILPPGRLPIELIGRGVTIITSTGESNLDPLKRFKGQPVVVRFLPEVEARRAMREVLTALELAGWKILSVTPDEELEHPTWDGVVIEPYHPSTLANLPAEQVVAVMRENERLSEVAGSLIKLLEDNDWRVKRGAGIGTSEIPPGSIRVSIGFKPPPEIGAVAREVAALTGRKPPVQVERTKARHIEDFQREIIDKKLAELPLDRLTIPLEIRCPAENKEACGFAEEILSILKARNWPVGGDCVIRDPDFPRRLSGLVIHDPLSAGSFPSASVLYEAFLYGSLTPELEKEASGVKSDPVRIMVGW